MLKDLKQLDGAKKVSKDEQKEINGGRPPKAPRCGGDGSFIYVDGKIFCCYDWSTGYYFC